MTNALLIYNCRLLDESMDCPGALLALEGKIRAVFQGYFTDAATVRHMAEAVLSEDGFDGNVNLTVFDAHSLTLTPAFIDMHVHLRDPGLTQKEDLNSGLHAAIAGGYGTVVAMPNTSPVVSSAYAALEIKRRGAALGLANLFQSVSITENFEGKSIRHLEELNREEIPLITEDGHEVASSAVMLGGMKLAAARGLIVSCHCEDPELAAAARPFRMRALELMEKFHLPAWGGSSFAGSQDGGSVKAGAAGSAGEFCASGIDDVPPEVMEEIDDSLTEANALLTAAEDICTERNIALAREAGCHVHMCHVSTMGAIDAIRRAKQRLADEVADFYTDMADAANDARLEDRQFVPLPAIENGFSVTCEVTPHHIALTGTEEPDIRALVNPPLRSEDDRLCIIDAIRDGTVDCIATDHAPHTLEDKAKGAPGFTGIETSYGVCNTVLVKEGQISARRLSALMSANPARILKLSKGLLKNGYDADLTLVDPNEQWTVDNRLFCSKGKATPFDGKVLTGMVKGVFIAGRNVYQK